MLRLIYFIPTYLIFLIFRTIMILLGLVLIPPLAILHKYTSKTEVSIVNGRDILNFKYKLMFPWNNNEDGIVAGEEFLGYPTWFRIIYWSAIRNPANNLRFVKGLSCKIEPSKVKYVGTTPVRQDANVTEISGPMIYRYDDDRFTFISLTYQGFYSNLRIQFKMLGKVWRFWIGWKLYPHDSLGIDENNYRAKGAGFATQFKRIYPR